MAPEHQEMNRQIEMTWRMLRTISHSLMVHVRVLEAYINFALMYTTDHFFPIIPIKDMINKDGDPTTTYKLATGTKPTVSNLSVLSCPCIVRKATAHVETKVLNMRHQSQKGFRVMFVGISQYQKDILCIYPVQGR